MIYVMLANGFEEIEALAVVDILRRADLSVTTVGIGGKTVCGTHGILVTADIPESDVSDVPFDALVLPGGMPGTRHLEASETVQRLLDRAVSEHALIGAICAAPSILGHKGLLDGRRATCFPGFESDLAGAVLCDDAVVTDGTIVTARGAGVALEFGFTLAALLSDAPTAHRLREGMQCL